MSFFRRNKDEVWHEGVPEGFKIWFWIRLFACGYVIYLGTDLIIKTFDLDLSRGYLALGIVLILVAIGIIVWDLRMYVKLRKTLKKESEEAEEDAEEDAPAEKVEKEKPVRKSFFSAPANDGTDAAESPGIRAYARYGAGGEDQEGEADDEIQELEEEGQVEHSDRVEASEGEDPLEEAGKVEGEV